MWRWCASCIHAGGLSCVTKQISLLPSHNFVLHKRTRDHLGSISHNLCQVCSIFAHCAFQCFLIFCFSHFCSAFILCQPIFVSYICSAMIFFAPTLVWRNTHQFLSHSFFFCFFYSTKFCYTSLFCHDPFALEVSPPFFVPLTFILHFILPAFIPLIFVQHFCSVSHFCVHNSYTTWYLCI